MKRKLQTIETKALTRAATVESVDEDERTVELSFSSEEPYERWFGTEVLDHNPESVRLDRLNARAPLLVDHNPEKQTGVIVEARVDKRDKKGRAVVRFGKGALASEIFDDVKDEIRVNASVGYRIHSMVLEKESDDETLYRVDDWEPFEISIVSVPADTTVGVGRSDDQTYTTVVKGGNKMKRKRNTDVDNDVDNDAQERQTEPEGSDQVRGDVTMSEEDVSGMIDDAIERAMTRQRDSQRTQRVSVEDNRPEPEPMPQARAPEVGLTRREIEGFSFVRAINALANPSSRAAQEAAAFEREVSIAAEQLLKREARGLLVPDEVLARDLTVGTATAGGHTVATDLLSESFIDILRKRTLVRQAGATILSGLVGSIAIPRHTTAASGGWVAENSAVAEDDQAFDQVAMSPKTVGAYTDISRKLLIQSAIGIENFVRGDLAAAVALQVDRVALDGDPDTTATANEPRGILKTTGTGAVVGGTNGAAPTWDHMVSLETEVAVDDADVGALAYMINAATRGKLKRTRLDTGSGLMLMQGQEINGYRAFVTNQLPSNTAKGSGSNLSEMIYGNWADLVIAEWSGIDLLVDPYSLSTQGAVRVVVFQDLDVAVRHAESFSTFEDIITT